MRCTLLEATQEILSAIDGSEVNCISDTVESYQVALILRAVYYDIVSEVTLPEHRTTFSLTASTDATLPTMMSLPSNVVTLDKVMYNHQVDDETNPNYVDITYTPFDEFVKMQQGLREQSSGVGEASIEGDNGDTFQVMYRTDAMPTRFTTWNDNTILFDGFDNTEETTLTSARTLCTGVVYPVLALEDQAVPDLDPTQFRFWINKAKVRAFAELKQTANQEALGEARRQKIITQKRKHAVTTQPAIKMVEARYGRK